MPIKIERISDDKCQLGEGPYWDEKGQSLYYVDIFGNTINRYDPSTNFHAKAIVGQKNTFLIGYTNAIAKIIWDGVSDKIESLEVIAALKDEEALKHRFNDGKADPCGRLWAGSIVSKTVDGPTYIEKGGTLYALKSDNTLTDLTSGITLTNGMAWNEKLKKFYYVDTSPCEVYEFDYDDLQITNKEVMFSFRETGVDGMPDGMTMDTDGNLWIACFGGGKVIKIDPTKPNTLLQTIDMPIKQVTSVEFGGPNYEDLYVTSANIAFPGHIASEGGWTYKITGLGVNGVPAREIKL